MSTLEQFKKYTTVVCDTGEVDLIAKYKPQDATTNPSLIFKAASDPKYMPLIDDAIAYGKKKGHSLEESLDLAMTKAFVNFGVEILKHVPGRVSTEVDARYSFDVMRSYAKAKQFIALYEKAGIDRSRILIKLASTWEGILVAKELEKEGIHCNMTLMFSLAQAIAAAEAKATLISPFVGRIYDWYKKNQPEALAPGKIDPGVESVTTIYHYYKHFGYATQVMGASFRNKEQILDLAGCDLLTIAPPLLEELEKIDLPVTQKLEASQSKSLLLDKMEIDYERFSWLVNTDPMASNKLYEGIYLFEKDAAKLRKTLQEKLQ